jgi:hypothetical protein
VKYKKTLVEIIEDISKTEGHKTPLTPEMIELTVDLALKVRPWTTKDMQSVCDIFWKHANSEMAGLYFRLVYALAALRNTTAKGKNKKMLTRYLNCRISVAPRHLSGTELMSALIHDVHKDLVAAWPFKLRRN